MEKIKVNMSPNPLDVQTIHASQNDGEARQWEFELHNNGELIDTSEITEQMFFKSYKGGTEQLLPENTSTPTTSPFLGDIRYPQGLLNDQEFTYRQSPTEEDGNAKITDIKGNTLVWNQIYNVNSDRTTFGVNIKVVNGAVSITGTSTNTGTGPAFAWTDFKCVQGHKYIITKDFALPSGDFIFDQYNVNSSTDLTTVVFTLTNSGEYIIPQLKISQTGVTYNISGHLCVYDLTKMFGAGNEPTTVEEFTSLFPLSYYSYNQGSLLSFNGNGIKTVGKNMINNVRTVGAPYNRNGVSIVLQNDGGFVLNGTCTGSYVLNIVSLQGPDIGVPLSKGSYILSGSLDGTSSTNIDLQYYLPSTEHIRRSSSPLPFTLNEQTEVAFRIYVGNGKTYNNDVVYPMVRFADVEDSSFEPYTSSALSLPISTYFPTGMKSAGNVYDELTESKAVTRVGTVTLNGTEIWHEPDSSGNCWMDFRDMKISTDYTQTMTATVTVFKSRRSMVSNSVTGYDQGTLNYLYFRTADATQSAENVRAYLQANPVTVNYELATPTETSFTTASLVTENGEIPLSNDDGVLIGKCTEELSAEPGFHDAKIKLSDADGECYSNKLQLHVERSPQ